MTLKLYSLVWLVVLTCQLTLLSAQRIAEPSGKLSHIRLPAEPLPADYTTYSLAIHPTRYLQASGFTAPGLSRSHLSLTGFKRVGSKGHFQIVITLEPFRILESEIKKYTTEKKDKEGNVTKTHRYEKEVLYHMPMTLYVEDYQGNILLETVGGGADAPLKFTYKKGKNLYVFDKPSKLTQTWIKEKVPDQLKKDVITSTMARFSELLRTKFDTRVVQSTFYLEQPKGKKAPNAELHEQHTKAAMAALSQLGPAASLEDTKAALAAPIAFWTEEMKKFSPADKKEKKLYHACLYNLAVSHYWLDELDVAERLANQLKSEVDWNKGRANSLLERIGKTRQLFAANELDSRYFAVEVPADASGPAEADYSHLLPAAETGDNAPVVNTNALQLGGYVIVKGDSLNGVFHIQDANKDAPRFYVRNNILFQPNAGGGSQSAIPVLPETIERMKMGDYHYRRTKKGVKIDVSNTYNYAFIRILEDGPRVSILERFPVPNEGNQNKTNYLQKAGEKMVSLSVTNVRWTNWKEAFAKYFGDCPSLAEEITAGNFKRNMSDIRRAARMYNSGECE